MKVVLIFTSLFLLAGCSRFETISKKIDQYKCSKKPFITEHKIRMMLYKNGKLDFINLKEDTLILNQDLQKESLIYNGFIIGSKGKICYTYDKPNDSFEFNKYGCDINSKITSWDTLGLKQTNQGNMTLLQDEIYLTRVIISNSKIKKIDRFTGNIKP